MSDQIIYEVHAKPINPMAKLTVKVTHRHLIFERGTLRSDTQQIPMAHVYDVDLKQSMTQKARGVGTVVVHVTRPGAQAEVVTLEDVPTPGELVRCLNDVSLQARQFEAKMQNTYYGGAPTPQQQWAQQPPAQPAPAPAAPAPTRAAPEGPSSDEIMGQIRKLGELRDAGILSEDEFQAKKTELLGRL